MTEEANRTPPGRRRTRPGHAARCSQSGGLAPEVTLPHGELQLSQHLEVLALLDALGDELGAQRAADLPQPKRPKSAMKKT